MSETKFTPGPWFAVNQGTPKEPMMTVMAARIAGKPPKHEVAICATGDSPQEMENANAHLIAAAPELYEALQRLSEMASFEAGTANPGQPFWDALERARVILRKANGETQ